MVAWKVEVAWQGENWWRGKGRDGGRDGGAARGEMVVTILANTLLLIF